MTRDKETEELRQMLALRASDDLTVPEAARVDEFVRYRPAARDELDTYRELVGLLRQAGTEPLPVDDRPSLWRRIEPCLGPAARYDRRRLNHWIPTSYLMAASILLMMTALYVENRAAPRRFLGRTMGPNELVDFSTSGPTKWVAAKPEPSRARLGVLVMDMDAALRRKIGFGASGGVLVESVLPNYPAERAGLRPGDILSSINGHPVHSAQQLIEVLRGLNGQPIRIEFLRGGQLEVRDILPDSGRSQLGPGFPAPELAVRFAHGALLIEA